MKFHVLLVLDLSALRNSEATVPLVFVSNMHFVILFISISVVVV